VKGMYDMKTVMTDEMKRVLNQIDQQIADLVSNKTADYSGEFILKDFSLQQLCEVRMFLLSFCL
jgi:hypothetical protein